MCVQINLLTTESQSNGLVSVDTVIKDYVILHGHYYETMLRDMLFHLRYQISEDDALSSTFDFNRDRLIHKQRSDPIENFSLHVTKFNDKAEFEHCKSSCVFRL